uniref:Uncharacterized protein n=1 Tax=Romanomermis culicivorax TaxID=13658 RepID=A0A915KZK0_ROMCU
MTGPWAVTMASLGTLIFLQIGSKVIDMKNRRTNLAKIIWGIGYSGPPDDPGAHNGGSYCNFLGQHDHIGGGCQSCTKHQACPKATYFIIEGVKAHLYLPFLTKRSKIQSTELPEDAKKNTNCSAPIFSATATPILAKIQTLTNNGNIRSCEIVDSSIEEERNVSTDIGVLVAKGRI